jgi:hypothetical protein
MALRRYSGLWPSPTGFRDHTQTHHTRLDFSGRVVSPTNRPLPDNTQRSHDPGEIRTHNPSKRAAADPRLRPLDHWNRRICNIQVLKMLACAIRCK